jgi:hypothetical protein
MHIMVTQICQFEETAIYTQNYEVYTGTVWLKLTKYIPDTHSLCRKSNYVKMRKNYSFTLSAEKWTSFSDAVAIFVMFDATHWIVSVSRKEALTTSLTQENR